MLRASSAADGQPVRRLVSVVGNPVLCRMSRSRMGRPVVPVRVVLGARYAGVVRRRVVLIARYAGVVP